jgi:hypothetical protein
MLTSPEVDCRLLPGCEIAKGQAMRPAFDGRLPPFEPGPLVLILVAEDFENRVPVLDDGGLE